RPISRVRLRTSDLPIRRTVVSSSGNSPATPRMPSVPKSFVIFYEVGRTGEAGVWSCRRPLLSDSDFLRLDRTYVDSVGVVRRDGDLGSELITRLGLSSGLNSRDHVVGGHRIDR